jgi:hypothetical protein
MHEAFPNFVSCGAFILLPTVVFFGNLVWNYQLGKPDIFSGTIIV